MTPIESLEAYSGAHPETVEELKEWPYRRFRTAFDAWQKREAAERVERQEDLHIAALYSNTNWDDEKNNREDHVRRVQDFYKSLRRSILDGPKRDEDMEPPDEQAAAFMRASKRNVASVTTPGESSVRQFAGD